MSYKTKGPIAHFIGIGGIGISALARWFLAKKWAVSGSDIDESGIIKEFRKEGVKVKIGPHKVRNVPRKASMVIYTSAIRPNNPELKAAQRLGIKPLSYPETLGCLTKLYKTVAVAGSHGKSTVTALIGLILKHAKFEPNIIVGTKLRELDNKNFYGGESSWLVLEADEWKGAFLNYSPFVSLVTNIDREHLDYYHGLPHLKKTFLAFLSRTHEKGFLVLNRDDKNLYSLRFPIAQMAKRKSLKIYWYSTKSPIVSRLRRALKIPGEHNVSNAMAALTAATEVFKIKKSLVLQVISAYRGAWRRFEYRGNFQLPTSNFQLKVYDDYAHHPTEIKATLKAFREKFPKHTLICVYQPHQAKRLQVLFKEFQTAFRDADVTLIMPIYQVAGRDKINLRYSSEALVRAIQRRHPKRLVFYLQNPRNVKKAITAILKSLVASAKGGSPPDGRTGASGGKPYPLPPILVMMGAGDIVNYTNSLMKK